jgi:hypothetical protein
LAAAAAAAAAVAVAVVVVVVQGRECVGAVCVQAVEPQTLERQREQGIWRLWLCLDSDLWWR